MDLAAQIREDVRRRLDARVVAIEAACEAALLTGSYGVLIYRDAKGDEYVGPHPSVPYGMIHEYPWGLPDWWPDR